MINCQVCKREIEPLEECKNCGWKDDPDIKDGFSEKNDKRLDTAQLEFLMLFFI